MSERKRFPFSLLRLLLFPPLLFLFPRVNSVRLRVYRTFSKTHRGSKEKSVMRGCTHACAAGRQAGTHACALLRDSSFLRATDAPIRGRVSFVIRENVNQSLLALALRWLSAPNLPRGSSSLFVFQRAALFGRSTLFVAFVADRFET